MRLQDLADPIGSHEALRPDRLMGVWRPTDPEPHAIGEVRIALSGGSPTVECFGAGGPFPRHASPVPASTIFAAGPSSPDGMAFFAEFKFDHMISRLQGNVNLGLLVLAGFHEFHDGSARSNHFTREFFYSSPSEVGASNHSGINLATRGSGARRLEAASLAGVWRNTNIASAGIVSIEIRESGEGLAVRSFGAGKSGLKDWGETQATTYAKDWTSPDAMAFSACFDAGDMACHLQANIKQGVLVVAYFTVFNDGSGRSNYFSREFYYKAT